MLTLDFITGFRVGTPGVTAIVRCGQVFVHHVQHFLDDNATTVTTGHGKEFTGEHGCADGVLDFINRQTVLANFKILLEHFFIFGNGIFD